MSKATLHETAHRGVKAPPPVHIGGDAYLVANDAARMLIDAGCNITTVSKRLRAHAHAGEVRFVALHSRSWLYHRGDVLELAERYRSA